MSRKHLKEKIIQQAEKIRLLRVELRELTGRHRILAINARNDHERADQKEQESIGLLEKYHEARDEVDRLQYALEAFKRGTTMTVCDHCGKDIVPGSMRMIHECEERDYEQAVAELAALRNPQRDTRTRMPHSVEGLSSLPPISCLCQIWGDGCCRIAYYNPSRGWIHYRSDEVIPWFVEFYRLLDWSVSAPVHEPIYTVATDGMPREKGWYWVEWLAVWRVAEYDGRDFLGSRSILTSGVTCYQRIRPPEEKK